MVPKIFIEVFAGQKYFRMTKFIASRQWSWFRICPEVDLIPTSMVVVEWTCSTLAT